MHYTICQFLSVRQKQWQEHMAFISNHHLSGIELHGHAHSSPTYCMRPCHCPKFINDEIIVEKTYYSKNIYITPSQVTLIRDLVFKDRKSPPTPFILLRSIDGHLLILFVPKILFYCFLYTFFICHNLYLREHSKY